MCAQIRKLWPSPSGDRPAEHVAARYVLDPESGFSFDIYECQVNEADRILGKYIETVVEMARLADSLTEHSRLIGAKPPEVFNALTIDILDEALLIVDRPITYESYTLEGFDSKPVVVGKGLKDRGELVRFDSIRFSDSHNDELEIVPQAEIVEYQLGSRPSVYNRLTFDPREQRIALMEIDTPQIQVS